MAYTEFKTARILSELYQVTFGNNSYEPYRITWADLRGIAGVSKLTDQYLRETDLALNEFGYTLIKFDNFLMVTQESDMTAIRLVPPRIVEEYLYEEEEDEGLEECESDDDDDDYDEDEDEDDDYDEDEDEDEDDLEDLDENGIDYGDGDIELGDIDSDKKKSE